MYGAFCATEGFGDLGRGEPRDVPEDEHLALVVRKAVERGPQALETLEADLLVTLVARADLLEGDLPAGAHVVERGIAGDTEDPGAEGHVALLVLADDP